MPEGKESEKQRRSERNPPQKRSCKKEERGMRPEDGTVGRGCWGLSVARQTSRQWWTTPSGTAEKGVSGTGETLDATSETSACGAEETSARGIIETNACGAEETGEVAHLVRDPGDDVEIHSVGNPHLYGSGPVAGSYPQDSVSIGEESTTEYTSAEAKDVRHIRGRSSHCRGRYGGCQRGARLRFHRGNEIDGGSGPGTQCPPLDVRPCHSPDPKDCDRGRGARRGNVLPAPLADALRLTFPIEHRSWVPGEIANQPTTQPNDHNHTTTQPTSLNAFLANEFAGWGPALR